MVSVILPTWNRAHLIADSIRSVLQQSYTDLELIIADDGSEDDTEQVVKAMADKRVHYFKLPHTGCTGHLKNVAIGMSSGEYIAFIDSDDLWVESKLEQQLQLLSAQPGIGFSITDAVTFGPSGVLSPATYPTRHTIEIARIFDRMKENRFVVYNPSIVMRRSCFETTGWFDETMPSGDFHFNMRMAWHFDAGIIFESLFLRRMHDTNTSEQLPVENYEEYINTFEFLFQHRMVDRKYLHRAKSHAFFEMGKLYAARRQPLPARRYYLASLRINPLQPGCYKCLAATFYNGH